MEYGCGSRIGELTVEFGEEIDLKPLGLGLKFVTEDFPRD